MPGGLYACVQTSPQGSPLERFLVDPPIPHECASFRTPIAVDDKRILMWVGEEHYPFCPDYIEETRLFGVSKRIPLGIDLKVFKPHETWMCFVHPRAVLDRIEPVHVCPNEKRRAEHMAGRERCITVLYYFVDAADSVDAGGRPVFERTIGDTTYTIPKLLPRQGEKYSPGIFLRLPFSHFEYILPAEGKVDVRVQKAMEDGINIIAVKDQ